MFLRGKISSSHPLQLKIYVPADITFVIVYSYIYMYNVQSVNLREYSKCEVRF